MANKLYQALTEMGVEELQEELVAAQDKLQKMQFGHAISPLENPNLLRAERKNIARLKTELRVREIAEQQ